MIERMAHAYEGSCLCGAITFVVDGEITDVSHCHCSMCRKAHGAAFATYANVAEAQHRFTHGEDRLRIYRSSGTVERLSCSVCGSPMLWRDPVHFPGTTSFPLGALDTPFAAPVQRHIFGGSKAPWHAITDAWPRED
jgi:hypothetical protein